MKPDRLGLIHVILLAIIVLWAGFFWYMRTNEIERHHNAVQVLNRLQQVETRIDQDVLRMMSYKLFYYDSFVDSARRLRRLQNELLSKDIGIYHKFGEEIAGRVDDYLEKSSRKLTILEHLTAKVAVLRNSVHYLPLAVESFQVRDDKVSNSVSIMLGELLAFNLIPDRARHEKLREKLGELAASETTGDQQMMLKNILSHANMNLKFMDEISLYMAEYFKLETDRDIEHIAQVYKTYYAGTTARSDYLSMALLMITVLLVFSLSNVLQRLKFARAQSEAASNQLRDAIESVSEAFAMFDADDRLVLWNSKYRDFYPRIKNRIVPGVSFQELMQAAQSENQYLNVSDDLTDWAVRRESARNGVTSSYMEHLENGRCILARDNCTSQGGIASIRIDITRRRETEMKLRKLSQAVEQSPASVIIMRTDFTIEYVNPKFIETSGYGFEEVAGQRPCILHSNDGSSSSLEQIRDGLTAQGQWRGEVCSQRKDGEFFWQAVSVSPIKSEEGEITHYVAIVEDISERRRAEEQLRLADTVFRKTAEAIMVTDADNCIKAVNPAFTDITGYQPAEVLGKSPRIMSAGKHDKTLYRTIYESLEKSGQWQGELWNERRNGEVYPLWISISTIKDAEGRITERVAIFSDITRRKRDENKIWHQANYDALTQLPNRTLFLDRLISVISTAYREKWRVALLFIDLDRFKQINDTLGHIVGDELLKQAAIRLKHCVREVDTVARLGGDEFTIILPDIHRDEDAALVSSKIIKHISEPFELRGQEIYIGASIGITIYPSDAEDVLEKNSSASSHAVAMLRHADLAMYRAKERGRNIYHFFTPEMNTQMRERISLENDLRHALARGELRIFYQPIVDVRKRRVSHAEALLRWQHPRRGLVSPDEFIGLAEETGLIGDIGAWVFNTACEQARAWQDAGHKSVGVSVNLSSRQLRTGFGADDISRMLAQNRLAPKYVSIEITESLIMEDTEHTVHWLNDVSDMGVGLSIDDFGTGYSSLSYLKRFPVNTLKIDRAFVHDVNTDPENATLVKTILAMASSLKLRVIAEGVESEEQLRFLRKLRCDQIQGYYFSRPLPSQEFLQFLRHRRQVI